MLRPSVQTVHILWAAFVLAVVSPALAQPKPPAFLGSTREQVVAKLGEPKSNLKAGTREVLFFPHLKLTLRKGVVVESEDLPDEAAPKRVSDAPAPAAPIAPAPPPPTAQQIAAAAALAANPEITNAQPANSMPAPVAAPVQTVAQREAPLEIKSVKSAPPPAKNGARPAGSAKSQPGASSKPTAEPAVESASPAAASNAASDSIGSGAVVVTARPAVMPSAAHPTVVEEISVTGPVLLKPVVDPKKKAEIRQRWRNRRDAETEDDSVQLFSTQSYVIAAITLAAGFGYLWWSRAQRNLELVATAVSHTPFEPTAATDSTGQFTGDLVGKLTAKRFERLVASYYTKTGVVAEQTNAAPGSPVHIKIFWKGEPKPFAGVQCHFNPPGLIGPAALQQLFDALTAAEIRRGYIVTNGKFNVEARDYAEEKHFTLLSGDMFLEKLNALPPAARGELLKETHSEESASSAGGPAVA